MIRKDRFDGKAGVAILISKGVTIRNYNSQTTLTKIIMVCGAALHNMNVISLYCPPNIIASVHAWNNLLSQHSAPILIGGDFNAHNTAWGCSKNDNKGTALLNACR